jgi:ABC-type sugar transport system substrate-binding protein
LLRTFRRRWMPVSIGLLVVFAAAAGTSIARTSSNRAQRSLAAISSHSSGSVKGKTVVLITCEASQNPWCGGINKEYAAKLKAAGAKVTVLQDAQDPAVQAQHFSQAIALHPDLIAFQADDENAVMPSLLRAHAAGIELLNWNQTITPAGMKLVKTSVIANNTQLGTFAAQNLVAGLKAAGYKKANIINITGTKSLPITTQRLAAFNAVLKKYPQYKVVAQEDSNFDPNLAGQQATQLLSQWRSKGGIQGAYGMADYLALSITSSAQQLNIKVGTKPGDLIVVGGNCTEPGVKAVESGLLAGDATQSPTPEADAIAAASIKVLEGKKEPSIIEVDENSITKANASHFLAQCTY